MILGSVPASCTWGSSAPTDDEMQVRIYDVVKRGPNTDVTIGFRGATATGTLSIIRARALRALLDEAIGIVEEHERERKAGERE